ADLATAGRRGAAYEVENLPVLEAIVGEPFDAAVLVEIDGDHPLVDRLLWHEGDRPLRALGGVVERLTPDGRAGGRRAEQNQHLRLPRADRNLLERPFRDDVALLIGLAEASPARRGARSRAAARPPARGMLQRDLSEGLHRPGRGARAAARLRAPRRAGAI